MLQKSGRGISRWIRWIPAGLRLSCFVTPEAERGSFLLCVCVFMWDRWSPGHGCHDRWQVFSGNDGLREEPDTDECPARTAPSPGHRPASPRSPRHQRAAMLFIDGSNASTPTQHPHTDTHTHTHRLWSDVTQRLTQADTNLVLCCYQKKKHITRWHNRICFSVCSKTKNKK